ncbi:preprotein translocase subunit SecG [Candidatus Curtissbacteria bacterium RIFCSPLOWO2_01_FULL_38_11b]|uniref:Protein-export membrane protein SecG n=1 Tax=Candidatus Curtissbacteria bacterium RIFCSPLOWO2_01_FULL_38_11b TaxID=1797725 RepID=A0A1F5H3V0_9BACT|nr:MAG: preprotein translocase subunit SecG [Candidatus Curtissbacteria bacterium RIFCSPLOWO2_01_FULL_38_11b]
MKSFLLIIQLIVSVSLVILILMQSRSGGLGTAFGSSTTIYRSRRGVEKLFTYFTIILAILFFFLSIILLLI